MKTRLGCIKNKFGKRNFSCKQSLFRTFKNDVSWMLIFIHTMHSPFNLVYLESRVFIMWIEVEWTEIIITLRPALARSELHYCITAGSL